MPTIDDFDALAVRTGNVLRAEPHTESRYPALKLWIDFGDLGELQSSAKITDRYAAPDLVGRQVVAVTGMQSMRVGGFRSDVLVLGALTGGGVVLLNTDVPVPPGSVVA
ncbi:MAG: tRNA-binding protein [Acidimicrobiia bacterium]|nr:tRNA-binding protein [Acidimicrobiia bacterium]NNC93476.1 tRNA-binding protein [Acidimicrobiia bacterium]